MRIYIYGYADNEYVLNENLFCTHMHLNICQKWPVFTQKWVSLARFQFWVTIIVVFPTGLLLKGY